MRAALTAVDTLLVTLAKYAISLRRPVQGNVPPLPIPICRVAATTRVSSSGGGIVVDSMDEPLSLGDVVAMS